MKHLLLSLTAFLMAAGLMAQTSVFNKGDKVVNAGIGFGSTLYTGTAYGTKIPPVSVSLEYGLLDDLFDVDDLNLGVGGYFGYTSYKWELSQSGWNYSSVILGARGVLHYPLVDNLDTYAGLMLGFNVVSSSSFGNVGPGYSAAGSKPVFSSYVGARYYFSDSFAGMMELGYGIAWINLGIAFKF